MSFKRGALNYVSGAGLIGLGILGFSHNPFLSKIETLHEEHPKLIEYSHAIQERDDFVIKLNSEGSVKRYDFVADNDKFADLQRDRANLAILNTRVSDLERDNPNILQGLGEYSIATRRSGAWYCGSLLGLVLGTIVIGRTFSNSMERSLAFRFEREDFDY